jgi:hypothetical protein
MFEIEDSTTASVENFFFQDLLPATTLDDTFLEQVVRPTGLPAIDPAAHLLNNNVNQAVLDHRLGEEGVLGRRGENEIHMCQYSSSNTSKKLMKRPYLTTKQAPYTMPHLLKV